MRRKLYFTEQQSSLAIGADLLGPWPAQQVRALGDVGGDPPPLVPSQRNRGNAADNSTDQRPRYPDNKALPFASGVILHDHRGLGVPRKMVARCVVTRLGIPPNGLIYIN